VQAHNLETAKLTGNQEAVGKPTSVRLWSTETRRACPGGRRGTSDLRVMSPTNCLLIWNRAYNQILRLEDPTFPSMEIPIVQRRQGALRTRRCATRRRL